MGSVRQDAAGRVACLGCFQASRTTV